MNDLDVSIKNWQDLTHEQQLDVAEYAVKKLGKEIASIPNVNSVGFGFREKGFRLTKEPCIKLCVGFKRKTNKKTAGQIPKIFTVNLAIDDTTRSYAVPSDVILIKKINLQGGVGGAGTQTNSALHPNKHEGGTACCYVRFPGYDDYYLLGCAHTFAMIRRFALPARGHKHTFETRSKPYHPNKRIGALKWLADLDYADAALVKVDNFQSMSTGYEPHGFRYNGIWLGKYPTNYSIHTRRGVIRCKWATQYKISPSVLLHTKTNSKNYRFPNIVCSQTINGYTRGGDSGSPLISDDGYLIGMHFAGYKGYAFSIPIKQVFSAFNPSVELVFV